MDLITNINYRVIHPWQKRDVLKLQSYDWLIQKNYVVYVPQEYMIRGVIFISKWVIVLLNFCFKSDLQTLPVK